MPKIRLYVTATLTLDEIITLGAEQSHYLQQVMRKRIGDEINLFNGRDGEFLATIVGINKKSTSLQVIKLTKAQQFSHDLWLIFSPIKHHRLSFLIEKSTELGVTKFIPVITRASVVKDINITKLEAIAIEASEQCERLDVPEFLPPVKLKNLFEVTQNRNIILCFEGENNNSIRQVLTSLNSQDKHAVMIGPEGGFCAEEITMLKTHKELTTMHLGPRILRAETASIAAIISYNLFIGEYNKAPRS
jgi:16S rRNA (uracil1498-N3)-methyltransferase